jgi:ABC-type multidrug transport system ATPase subunit
MTAMTEVPNEAPTGQSGTDRFVAPRRALRVDACGVSRVLRNGARTLTDVSLGIDAGHFVAVIGASGAGKTTLLETLAGLRRPSSGTVCLDGRDLDRHRDVFRAMVGYVPQDDIIHRELPVRETLRHAARLRLPHLGRAELDGVVDRTIDTLGLRERASTVVGQLSGGQRKRVSIAVELLTRPRAFFLDEPTSGLDPGTARSIVTALRRLTDDGSTIVITTHNPDDVVQCDEVVVLGRGGRLLFHGTPKDALEHFHVDDIADVYRAVEDQPESHDVAPRPCAEPASCEGRRRVDEVPSAPVAPATLRHQWAVLTRRNVAVLARNRLTLAIMLGAPVLVIAMFVLLFRPGAFDARGGNPLAAVGITYWLAFAAFFFGLTYGLLQVCTEIAVVRREHHVGLGLGAYILAKATVLVPVLLLVTAAMVMALRVTGRLPGDGWTTTATLIGVLLLEAVAALALGLLASAAVADPTQATLALPMLCFPAVLFGGAVLSVQAMATVGRVISVTTTDRWAFEALGRILTLGTRFKSGSGAIVSQQHGDAFAGGLSVQLAVLTVSAVVFLAATTSVLHRRTATR